MQLGGFSLGCCEAVIRQQNPEATQCHPSVRIITELSSLVKLRLVEGGGVRWLPVLLDCDRPKKCLGQVKLTRLMAVPRAQRLPSCDYGLSCWARAYSRLVEQAVNDVY